MDPFTKMPHGRGNRDTFKCDGGCYYDKAMKKKVGAGRDRTTTVDPAAKCQLASQPPDQAKKMQKNGDQCLRCRKLIKVRPSACNTAAVCPVSPCCAHTAALHSSVRRTRRGATACARNRELQELPAWLGMTC